MFRLIRQFVSNSFFKAIFHTTIGSGMITSLVLYASAAAAAPVRVSDFALLDNQGTFHQLSRYLHKNALVVMSYAPSCENMDAMLADYKSMQAQWAEQEISFLLIDSTGQGRQKLSELDLGIPILDDEGQLVSEALGITHAGQVTALNPERAAVYYQGPTSELLLQTLTAVVNDNSGDTVTQDMSGCDISYPVQQMHAAKVPDYATEVAPIIAENCAECHRQGGVGPFAIDSHLMLMGWSPMIREVLLNKRMPPTQMDPFIGHSADARYVSPKDIQTVIHWINAGAPRGEGEIDPLENLTFPGRTEWLLGEPDFIVTGPDNEVPPTGVLDYIYLNVDLPFTEDKWLSGVQYMAGDESVLHHLMTYVTAPDEDFFGPEKTEQSVTRRFVAGYAPGEISALQYPEGTGVLIPAGHRLSMQFHYVTNGRATVDETLLGLYFYDEPPAKEYLTLVLSGQFEIPPNDPDVQVQQEHLFDRDIILTGVRAHMHFRGKRMKFTVQSADGQLRDILSIPAYNYGWQPQYQLEAPVAISAGSKVIVSGAFDNSISNPSNPDPEKTVGFGVESWDEMFTGYFSYHYAD